ncbi:hypothetical protein ACFU8R_28490 [Pseudonocardia alni]|jgi:hypothetical protein|uniref:hypothetical protein n=1 Tax=Pseudonocardia TaxID=1847 RepID=UPI001867728F|nr:hypothetical protein [Pseudonocardia autotrophica]
MTEKITDRHPPPWTHAVRKISGEPAPIHHLTDYDGQTIYRGTDGDRVLVLCQHANAETGVSPV